jgi:hypothetical protein
MAVRPSADVSVRRFVLAEVGKEPKTWTAELHLAHLTLADAPLAQPFVVLREEMMKTAILIEGLGTLILSKPCKANLKLQPEDARSLADWIGLPVLARYYLRRRYGWVLPVAVIWLLGSMPVRGDTEAGITAHPFDPIALTLGLTLVVAWAFAKWRPHRALFLVDSLWFLGMSGHLIMMVLGGRSAGWLVLVVAFLWFTWTGVKHFIRFRGINLAAVAPRSARQDCR